MIIATTNLTRRFGAVTAVDSLNLSVPENCVFGFLGPNGAGKTTTIRLLLGLIRPDRGEMELFGRPVRTHRLFSEKKIGALVETPSLYAHLSGRDNLEVTRRLLGIKKEDVTEALRTAGIEKASRRRVVTYSLGMKQRLAIALAILGRPELLILDEPTNGLDPAGIIEIRELIKRLPREFGISVFISSHLLSEVELVADSIAVIQSGRLKFQGTLKELQTRKQSRIRLKVNDPAGAVQILKDMGYDAFISQDFISISTEATDDTAARINSRLVEKGFDVCHLSSEQPSLEDLFLSLTSEDKEVRS